MKRFIIVGLGNFGASAAEALYAEGHDVIALDLREEAVDAIAPHVTRAAVGDGRQAPMLEQVGAKGADAAVVSTGEDITASILSTMALRDLGVEQVYAKVISRDHARVMTRLGVTETIFPEREAALNLASRLSEQSVINYVHVSGDLSIQEMVVPSRWRGRTLRELQLRQQFGLSVVALHNIRTDRMVVPPDPDDDLADTDTLLLAGSDENLERVARETED